MKEKPEITERAQHLLKVLIKRYIKAPHPVASKTLSDDENINLSPATIRNIMADLEERGFLISPHTSAGRIPTALGYRFFVDSLLSVDQASPTAIRALEKKINAQDTTSTFEKIESVSNLLSNITQLAGVITLPKPDKITLRHVEFLSLAENRVLVILVLNEKEVQNRIIYTARVYTESELTEAANYLNEHYVGCDLTDLHEIILKSLNTDRETMQRLMQTVLDVADKAFEEQPTNDDFIVSGQTNLLNVVDNKDMTKLKLLFDAFSKKHDILHLLDRCVNAKGVQIFIGEESGYKMLDECSVVTSSYEVDGKVAGALGVIGPTRMYYDKVIPIVEITARLLSAALNKSD